MKADDTGSGADGTGEGPADTTTGTAQSRLRMYLETLRIRMPKEQYRLVTDLVRGWLEGGGGTLRVRLDAEERELFTPEAQGEVLILMGLIGALDPRREEAADYVVADLGDGTWVKGVRKLVPRRVAEDPVALRRIRDRLDAEQEECERDRLEVEAMARANGLGGGFPDD